MRRNMIVQGDKTTNDGIVLDGEPTACNDGVPLAFHGARIHCPTCKSEGQIVADGPSWPMRFHGKQVALENDLCICKCEPPPRLIASKSSMFMTFESNALAEMGYAADGTRLPPDQWKFIAFKVEDVGSLEGMGCTAHFDDGSTATGVFDYQNVARFEQPTGKVCQRVTLASGESSTSSTFADAFLSILTA